ncbi:MAG: ATP-binding protein [Rhodomicrobium sp.]
MRSSSPLRQGPVRWHRGLCRTTRDTGIGMSSEEIKDALELFRKVDNSYLRRFEGIGLGLPLAVQLTELDGGTLTIDSTIGVGTTPWFASRPAG